jgi:hypothetical protein
MIAQNRHPHGSFERGDIPGHFLGPPLPEPIVAASHEDVGLGAPHSFDSSLENGRTAVLAPIPSSVDIRDHCHYDSIERRGQMR